MELIARVHEKRYKLSFRKRKRKKDIQSIHPQPKYPPQLIIGQCVYVCVCLSIYFKVCVCVWLMMLWDAVATVLNGKFIISRRTFSFVHHIFMYTSNVSTSSENGYSSFHQKSPTTSRRETLKKDVLIRLFEREKKNIFSLFVGIFFSSSIFYLLFMEF